MSKFPEGLFFSFLPFLFLINVISDVCFLYKQILLSEEMWELQTYL